MSGGMRGGWCLLCVSSLAFPFLRPSLINSRQMAANVVAKSKTSSNNNKGQKDKDKEEGENQKPMGRGHGRHYGVLLV